jgi:opacity protein-like surface antigen
MKTSIAAILAWMALMSPAYAQAPASAPAAGRGYVEGVAQAAFGNVTSQSYGVEAGVSITPVVQVFGEFGRVNDTTPASLANSAALIAGYLSQTASNVGFSAKQPVTFGVVGLRFPFSASSSFEPYVMVAGGAAQVKKDVAFTIGGSDVTGSLPQYGVVLGSDLSGSETKAMLSLGGGVVWTAWQMLIVDFQYRYGRVFTDDKLNINRAGVGIGVRF